jgi:cell division protein FtsL
MKHTSLPGFSAFWSWGVLLWAFVLAAILISALLVVWVKHHIRLASTELHKAVSQEYALQVEAGRLELEYNHLLSNSRVELTAKDKLSMQILTSDRERILLLPESVWQK